MVRGRLQRVLNPPARDDASIAYRIAVCAVVFVPVLAAVTQHALGVASGLAALALTPVGFVFSYRRRVKRNVLLKVALACLLLLVFGVFLTAVRHATNVDETRAPLVAMFVWVQVMHGFDVPRARDLSFSIAAAVALIALAGSLAFSSGFIVLVAIFAPCFLAALMLAHHSELVSAARGPVATDQRSTRPRSGGRVRPLLRAAAMLGVGTMLATSIVFVFIPRLPGAQLASLQFSFVRRPAVPGFSGAVMSPGGRRGSGRSGSGGGRVYFGYGDSVDLRVRTRLSNELVMRVRTPRPALYRAQAFDHYESGEWTSTSKPITELRSDGTSISVPENGDDLGSTGPELVQTFFVEQNLPNVIFHAYRAQDVYVSSTRLRVDDFSSMRLPFFLEKDTIYSVISNVPDTSRAVLRTARAVNLRDPAMARYLQMPPSLSPRFRSLALSITGSQPTTVDKAAAVEAWLHANKRYRLDIPEDPPGKDPVDVFVFDRRDGFCEQIAATMTLMLRASGVPARLVTGFGHGQRNVFTGYWEIRNSNAHAWVEVLYPGHGWITYDPTFGVPNASPAETTFMFGPVQRFAARVMNAAVFRAAGAAASRAVKAAPALVAIIALAAAAGFIGLVARRRAAARARRDERDRAVRAWLELERRLRRRGLVRAPSETAAEFAARASPSLGSHADALRVLAEDFGSVRYGANVTEDDARAWEERAREAARAIKTRSRD